MVAARWITVFVGSGKTEFKLPADTLAHYSRFFKRAIDRPLSGDERDTILLPDICTEDFEIFVEFIFKRTLQDALTVEKWGDAIIERCVSFVVFAKELDLGPVDEAVYDLFKAALEKNGCEGFRPHHIENIFCSTSPESMLRVLITKVALSMGAIHLGTYRNQETEVHGFAAELLRQIRLADLSASWTDPLSGEKRTIGGDL
ncbi:hypothetical protein VTL71DRAFT_8125 [Oculimacula yallundae]|uniref:BTB domain-containing protein n=1 Tax=Oculimacula yallundae TaxID=86028 RepID=A0ABR4CWX6_9HELO